MEPQTAESFSTRIAADRLYYPIFVCVVIAGFLIRIDQLGMDSLWIDEAFTGFIALTYEWLDYLRRDNTPPLYYLLQRSWCLVYACDETGIRLTSVLAGTLFLILTGRFCEQLYGRKVALIMLLFVTIAPLHVYYSQEARVYSILMTVLMWFLYLQWQLIEKGVTVFRISQLYIAATFAFYLHYFSVLLIGICLAVCLVEHWYGYRKVPRGYFIAVVAAMLTLCPWLYFSLFGEQATSAEINWIGEYLADKSLWQMPLRSMMIFLNGPLLYNDEMNLFVKRYSFADINTAFHGVYYLFITLFAGGWLMLWAGNHRLPAGSRQLLTEVSLFLFLPLILLVLISLLLRPVYVVGRYDLIVYPVFILLSGFILHAANNKNMLAVSRLPVIVMAVCLIFSGLMAWKIVLYRHSPPYNEVRDDIGVITEQLKTQDSLLIANPQAILYWYYLHLAGYDRRDGHCIGPTKEFVCRLVSQTLEQAPALQQRYFDLVKTGGGAAPDIGYFLDTLSATANIILLVDQLTLEQGALQLDPIGFQLVTQLRQAGYQVEQVIAGARLLRLRPSG